MSQFAYTGAPQSQVQLPSVRLSPTAQGLSVAPSFQPETISGLQPQLGNPGLTGIPMGVSPTSTLDNVLNTMRSIGYELAESIGNISGQPTMAKFTGPEGENVGVRFNQPTMGSATSRTATLGRNDAALGEALVPQEELKEFESLVTECKGDICVSQISGTGTPTRTWTHRVDQSPTLAGTRAYPAILSSQLSQINPEKLKSTAERTRGLMDTKLGEHLQTKLRQQVDATSRLTAELNRFASLEAKIRAELVGSLEELKKYKEGFKAQGWQNLTDADKGKLMRIKENIKARRIILDELNAHVAKIVDVPVVDEYLEDLKKVNDFLASKPADFRKDLSREATAEVIEKSLR